MITNRVKRVYRLKEKNRILAKEVKRLTKCINDYRSEAYNLSEEIFILRESIKKITAE